MAVEAEKGGGERNKTHQQTVLPQSPVIIVTPDGILHRQICLASAKQKKKCKYHNE
jgi:hypothetical protein